jgi:hypothetical protein
VASEVFCEEFFETQTLAECEATILNAVRRMPPLWRGHRVRLVAALAAIVEGDVDFACRVLKALCFRRSRREAAWTFKLFTSLVRLGLAGALRVHGDPVRVVGWFYERC